ncbi:Diacetyl reductase [(S)-acetoin forming] [Hypsizygus marmoreus]|uniref:Diacetyl reductase [(S)-acetoin forming] n=1 Tax=Hypsizygus marmoreus TaxID=39966 RepID=A0A369K0J6_HYPMA|nr:Diacetyl reductase [(S)-acetoin forming] [Hypsizygus marmoreus]
MSSLLGVAFVTGASQGIGRAIALRLADDGFDVALNDLPSSKDKLDAVSKEITAKGRRTWIALGDISVEDNVQSMISTVVENLGQLDVMVANAGICLSKPVLDTTVADWDRLFSVNVRGTFLCYKYAAAQMIKQGHGGRIIGASSIAGQEGFLEMSAYSGTKFAIRGLTQSASKEWGPHNITVNVYCPGAIETEMLENLGKQAGSVEKFYEFNRSLAPVGYNGTPDDVANVVSFLASKESHFITGGASFSLAFVIPHAHYETISSFRTKYCCQWRQTSTVNVCVCMTMYYQYDEAMYSSYLGD